MAKNTQAIVERQILRWNTERDAQKDRCSPSTAPRPVITVSRQLGSGGAKVAIEVAARMNCTFIGCEIIDDIAQRSGVCKELVHALDERTRSQQEIWIDSIINKTHFDESDYYRHLLAAVRSLAEMGSVVMLGRGACFIETSRPKINVRVIAPVIERIGRIAKRLNCNREEAKEMIIKKDRERAIFIKSLFDKEIDDPLHYDIVINTETVSIPRAAALIERVWFHSVSALEEDNERQMMNKQPEY